MIKFSELSCEVGSAMLNMPCIVPRVNIRFHFKIFMIYIRKILVLVS
jgi:hypothetical protein